MKRGSLSILHSFIGTLLQKVLKSAIVKTSGEGPEQLVGTALIFKRQQVWELKKHYSMDPFPSHSTLVALASRLGVEEQQVQDWFLIKQYFRSRPPEFSDNCFVHSGLDSHEPTLFCMFCTCPSPNGDQQSVPEEALPKRPWSLLVYGK
ncbi:uncharacterized protein LOC144371016 isoform X8 [Ictidomys tridecemlineatus]